MSIHIWTLWFSHLLYTSPNGSCHSEEVYTINLGHTKPWLLVPLSCLGDSRNTDFRHHVKP